MQEYTGKRVNKPTITLLSREENNTTLLECRLNNYYPEKITVQWLKDGRQISETQSKKLQSNQGEKTFTFISQISIEASFQAKMYTCKATHNSEDFTKTYNMCKEQSLSTPLINIKKPNLRDIMKEGKVTASCVVEAPYNTKVSWSENGELTTKNINTAQPRTQMIVSNLTLPRDKWFGLKEIVCAAEHPCFNKIEKSVIVADDMKKNPVVMIRRTFTDQMNADSAVLECVVTDLQPGEFYVIFQANGVDVSEGHYVDLVPSDNTQTLTTRFRIPREHETKHKIFTCKVYRSPSKQWISKPTGNIFDDPTIELGVVPSGSKSSSEPQKLVCSGTGFNPKIRWLSGSKEKTATSNEITMTEDGRVKVYSEVLVPQQGWNEGVTFTCEIIDRDPSKPVMKSASICAEQSLSTPLINIKKPNLRDIMKEGKVTASCVVEAPYNTKVSWSENGELTTKNINTGQPRTQMIVSNLTLPRDKWFGLKKIVCAAEHPCFNKIEKSVIVADDMKKNPVVKIRRTFTDQMNADSAVLECVVTDLQPGEFYVIFQANGVDVSEGHYVDLVPSDNTQTLTTRFRIPREHETKHKIFTCKVYRSPSKQWISKPTGKIFDDPTIELGVVPSESKSSSEPQKLVCSGTGFNPKIRWLSGSKEKTATSNEITMREDGRVKVYSEVLVPQQDWNERVTFTCEIVDRDPSKPVKKSASICAVNSHSSQLPEVYVRGPSLRDGRPGTNVHLICLVVGQHVKDFTIQWKVNGNTSSLEAYTPNSGPKDHANGTQSIQNILVVPTSTWHAKSLFTCEVIDTCSGKTQQQHISKPKDPKQPTVKILRPSDSDLSRSQNNSLLCLITGFSPSDISVHWQLNGEQLDKSHFTYSSVAADTARGFYSMYSALILPASPWKEGKYCCVVNHESSESPIIDTLENLYVSLRHSAPSVEVLQGPSGLVCLVFGFSPSAINITWLLRMTEQPNHNITRPTKGPDGKFSIQSHLYLASSDWAPGEVYTCRVSHVTGTLLLNVSKPEIFEEAVFLNENKPEAFAEDTLEAAWNMAWAFLVLFLLSLFYGCIVTLIKVKPE